MPHGDQLQLLKQRHDGEQPPSWFTGDIDFRKASVLAAVAWHNIKDDADPDLRRCDRSHVETCIAVTESIIAGNAPDNTPFANEVARLWAEVTTSPKGETIQ